MPGVVRQGDRPRRASFEFLDVRLAKAIGRRLRQGDLAIDRHRGRDGGANAGQHVDRPRDPVGLKAQLRRDAPDESGGRLEPEGRACKRALLVLEHPGEIYLAVGPEIVFGGEAVDRGRGDRKGGALLELRAHLRGSPPSLEKQVRVPELDLPRGVIDRVVRAPAQQGVAYVNPLAALANLKAVQ